MSSCLPPSRPKWRTSLKITGPHNHPGGTASEINQNKKWWPPCLVARSRQKVVLNRAWQVPHSDPTGRPQALDLQAKNSTVPSLSSSGLSQGHDAFTSDPEQFAPSVSLMRTEPSSGHKAHTPFQPQLRPQVLKTDAKTKCRTSGVGQGCCVLSFDPQQVTCTHSGLRLRTTPPPTNAQNPVSALRRGAAPGGQRPFDPEDAWVPGDCSSSPWQNQIKQSPLEGVDLPSLCRK